MYYYLVGQNKEIQYPKEGLLILPWEIQGLFATPEEAEAACLTEYYFVMQLEIGVALPHETSDTRPGWRPKIDERPEWATERKEP